MIFWYLNTCSSQGKYISLKYCSFLCGDNHLILNIYEINVFTFHVLMWYLSLCSTLHNVFHFYPYCHKWQNFTLFTYIYYILYSNNTYYSIIIYNHSIVIPTPTPNLALVRSAAINLGVQMSLRHIDFLP